MAHVDDREIPQEYKFTIGDRIAALDAFEALIEATYMRDRMHHLRQANQGIAKLRFLLDSRKTIISSCTEPSQFLGFELQSGGCRRLPADNVRRFRNRLRALRDRWRPETIEFADINARVRALIAHAEHADTWCLRHATFRGGWSDPANILEAWAPLVAVLFGDSWNNNPQNLKHQRQPKQQPWFPGRAHAFRQSRCYYGRTRSALSVQGRSR